MPKPEADLLDRTRFAELIQRWTDDTEHISSTSQIANHPACREIIAMGEAAVPLLLEEIDNHPTILGLIALRAITGTNPFPPEARGDVARMSEAWLAWGREHGYRR
jgi:hypothetical protein